MVRVASAAGLVLDDLSVLPQVKTLFSAGFRVRAGAAGGGVGVGVTSGRERFADDGRAAHVVPVGDLIDHETVGDGCLCMPRVEAVFRDDGSNGWVVTHHSLDGREFREADRVAPPWDR